VLFTRICSGAEEGLAEGHFEERVTSSDYFFVRMRKQKGAGDGVDITLEVAAAMKQRKTKGSKQ
jgi:hypothetical protein